MADGVAAERPDETHDTAQVAALMARAGVRLPAAQIAELVSAYRADRASFERLRQALTPEDEPLHTFDARDRGQTPRMTP
ncbi:MAG: hypothetical protein IT306_03920 [Chloroflexi bacterium]|nr:hypothetical protein [Chloroflexota bacterium]